MTPHLPRLALLLVAALAVARCRRVPALRPVAVALAVLLAADLARLALVGGGAWPQRVSAGLWVAWPGVAAGLLSRFPAANEPKPKLAQFGNLPILAPLPWLLAGALVALWTTLGGAPLAEPTWRRVLLASRLALLPLLLAAGPRWRSPPVAVGALLAAGQLAIAALGATWAEDVRHLVSLAAWAAVGAIVATVRR